MRDLTAEELALAPEWAYYYDFFDGMFVYMAKGKDSCGNYKFFSEGSGVYFGHEGELNLCTRLVPRKNKPFDITKHEWSDVIAEIEAESGNTLVLKFQGSWISLDKDDAIAIAKDRGLTAEDLK